MDAETDQILDDVKKNLNQMTYLIDAIRRRRNDQKDHMKAAKKLRKEIKRKLALVKSLAEQQETDLFDVLIEDD